MHRRDYCGYLAIGYHRLSLVESNRMYFGYSIWLPVGIYSSWKRQRSILYQELIVLPVQIIYNSFISRCQYSINSLRILFPFKRRNAAAALLMSYPIIFNASMGLKLMGGSGRKSSLYQIPKPLSANLFHGKLILGSSLRVGAISPCPMKLS